MRENLGFAMGVIGFVLIFVSAGLRWHAHRTRSSSHLAHALEGAALPTIITAFILLPSE